MRFVKDESGQALVMTAVSMSLLMGFLALAVDVGMLFRERRQMQIAADAAAAAAALDLKYNGSVATAQERRGRKLGFSERRDEAPRYVTINLPRRMDLHRSVPDMPRLSCSSRPRQYFMRLFRFDSITVAPRAVAGSAR